MGNKKILKSGISLSLSGGLTSLVASLFLAIPVFYATTILFSITKNTINTRALLTATGLIFSTLLKIGLSITIIVLSFKARKLVSAINTTPLMKKYQVTLSILLVATTIVFIVSKILGFSIKYIEYADIIACVLMFSSASLFIINLIIEKKSKIAPPDSQAD